MIDFPGLRAKRAVALAVMAAIASPLGAHAADRWEEGGSGAVAILPTPAKATLILGGSLSCAEQSWSFRLRTGPRATPAGPGKAVVTIGDDTFADTATQTSDTIALPVSNEMLEAMKSGNRLGFSLGKDEGAPQASFSLRDSGKVIAAITPRCSQVDMSAFDKIELRAGDAAVETARPLVADDIRQFAAATSATPMLSAGQVERDGGRQMLFATLCGSKWYYGRSGCTLLGFVRDGAQDKWRRVYDSEGMALYLDPKTSNGGWPDVVTLPVAGPAVPLHWVFTGTAYAVRDVAMAGDAPHSESEGDAEQ